MAVFFVVGTFRVMNSLTGIKIFFVILTITLTFKR